MGESAGSFVAAQKPMSPGQDGVAPVNESQRVLLLSRVSHSELNEKLFLRTEIWVSL